MFTLQEQHLENRTGFATSWRVYPSDRGSRWSLGNFCADQREAYGEAGMHATKWLVGAVVGELKIDAEVS
jgi:hypothetical protein